MLKSRAGESAFRLEHDDFVNVVDESSFVYTNASISHGRITGCSEKCLPDGGQSGMLAAKLTRCGLFGQVTRIVFED